MSAAPGSAAAPAARPHSYRRLSTGFLRAAFVTPSFRNAVKDLKSKSLAVVHSGDKTFPLATGIRAMAFSRLLTDLEPVRK